MMKAIIIVLPVRVLFLVNLYVYRPKKRRETTPPQAMMS